MQNKYLKKLYKEGVFVIHNFIDKDILNSLCKKIDLLESNNVQGSKQILYTHAKLPKDISPLDSIMTQWLNPCKKLDYFSTQNEITKLKNVIKKTFGNLIFFQEMLMSKKPGQKKLHWHQDYPFFPLDKPNGFTCWIALDKIREQNGGLMFAKNSNNKICPSINLYNGYAQDNSGFNFVPDNNNLFIPSFNKGDAVFFHSLIFHASAPNLSTTPRRSWATVWFEEDVKWKKINTPNHPLCQSIKDGELIEDLI